MTLYSSIRCSHEEFLDIIAELENEIGGELKYWVAGNRGRMGFSCHTADFSTIDAHIWFSKYFSNLLPYSVEVFEVNSENFDLQLGVNFELKGTRI